MPTLLPKKWRASLEEIDSGLWQVMTIDPAVWDDPNNIPVVVLYAGALSGLTWNLKQPSDGTRYIVALAVEMDLEKVDVHGLNHPVLCHDRLAAAADLHLQLSALARPVRLAAAAAARIVRSDSYKLQE